MGTRHYDKAFKENTVKLSYERSNQGVLAKKLDISKSQLSKWRKESEEYGKSSFSDHGIERLTDQDRHIKELEKELRTSRLELDMLKIAMAIFSKIDK